MLSRPERWLQMLLLLFGGVTTSAVLAILLPTNWMAATHEWLGLGAFPRAPLTEYLTRSIAGMYAIHGGFVLVAASDVRRFAPIITYFAIADSVFGVVLFAIDLFGGLPWYWTLFEGPSVIIASGLILWLQYKAENQTHG